MLKTRFVFMVGGADDGADKHNLDDTYVFEVSPSSFTGAKLKLYSGVSLQDKWPALYKNIETNAYGDVKIATIQSDRQEYLLIQRPSSSMQLLDMDSGTMVEFSIISKQDLLQSSILLSTTKQFTIYASHTSHPLRFAKYHFTGSAKLSRTKAVVVEGAHYICQADGNKVLVQVGVCNMPIDWNIKTGFIDGHSVYLFDQAIRDWSSRRPLSIPMLWLANRLF